MLVGLHSGCTLRCIVMKITEPYDVIIVGGGPAGLTAGLYCMRAAMNTVLFEKGLPGGQVAISKEVENYPGVEDITGMELVEKLLKQVRGFGLSIVQEEVAAVTVGADFHEVRLANGERRSARALILASGASVRKLGIPGEAEYLGHGVSYCATCDGFFFRGKTVVVVGGGDTALEEALYLSRLTKKVFLIHRRDTFRAARIFQNRLKEEPLIEVIWNTLTTSIKGDGGTVSAVAYENVATGKKGELPTDGVFIFIGSSPNNSLVPPQIRLNELGFVITDEKCETNVPGIFAAGDLRQKYASQIVVATSDGTIAALAAARYVEMHR